MTFRFSDNDLDSLCAIKKIVVVGESKMRDEFPASIFLFPCAVDVLATEVDRLGAADFEVVGCGNDLSGNDIDHSFNERVGECLLRGREEDGSNE